MKILISEDDTVSRLLLSTTLKQLGYEVIATENGRDAWGVFQQEHVPVIISDWMMPDIDGLQLCRMIRSEDRTRYTYFILLTVLVGKGYFMEGMNAGADDFVTKPFDKDQLAARLRVAERILQLQSKVNQLEGLLPICMYCKKIRDDRHPEKNPQGWARVEDYVESHTDATFSHGICPDCHETQVKPEMKRLLSNKADQQMG
jgi:DNA-binding response OmpR family regulator